MLQQKLDEFTTGLIQSGKIPGPVLATLQQSTEALIESRLAERSLKAGERAPAFKLSDADGTIVDSEALLRRGPLVVSFYRGVWCPYCNIELQALEAARPDIERRGAQLVAVSMQNATNSRKAQRDNQLGFPILVDFCGELAEQFGLRFKLSDAVITLYRNVFGNNLEEINGENSWTLPMPGRYVISQDGIVAYAEVNPDFTRRPDPSELLPVLDSLARTGAA
jgi:peroxiredoxin